MCVCVYASLVTITQHLLIDDKSAKLTCRDRMELLFNTQRAMRNPKPKMTIYIDEGIRTRAKTAAAHSRKSLSEFLMPFIEAAIAAEEEKMRKQLTPIVPLLTEASPSRSLE